MARTRRDRSRNWYLRSETSHPSAGNNYVLSRFNRPEVVVIDYTKEHSFRSRFIVGVFDQDSEPGTVDVSELSNLLAEAARGIGQLPWKVLLEPKQFRALKPVKPQMPARPEAPILPNIAPPKLKQLPPPPLHRDAAPKFSFWQQLIPPLRDRAVRRARQQADSQHQTESRQWESELTAIKQNNSAVLQAYDRKKAEQLTSGEASAYAQATAYWAQQNQLLESEHQDAISRWQAAKRQFEAADASERANIAALHDSYIALDREAIQTATVLVLEASRYPSAFPRNVKVHYKPENRIAIVDFQLPDFQTIDIVKNFKKTGQRERTQLQEEALYALALRTLHEVVCSDEVNAIDSVVFNGWVHFIDGATGQPRTAYILSVHATKSQIVALNISQVDAIECFRSLKGVSAKRVSAYTPIAPVLMLNKDDDRLVEGRQVIDGLTAGDNLAAMDWDTFEHLVRELFEKVFSKPGTEVKITRASRDRGVDAIVYDPDPIRGGKFVIQAKKYTNTVDVSAVRDLFGTVQAEGANRGLLVTTSQFGPDAYEFAKDKNISLLDGANLLHLFDEYGYTFRIDLKEARQLMGLST